MENTQPRCNPDADSTSAGGQWQGFALGAGNVNFQTIDGNGMLWQIRDVAPDPDNNAPVITGGEIGEDQRQQKTNAANHFHYGNRADKARFKIFYPKHPTSK